MTGQVKTTPGAIGYVELAYARQNQLPIVLLSNRAGQFIAPSTESITAAAASVAANMPDDLRVSIVDPPGASAYPVAAFTYILVYQDISDPAHAEALARFLWWASHDGQRFAPPLNYAPLPGDVVARVESKLSGLRSQGRPCLETDVASFGPSLHHFGLGFVVSNEWDPMPVAMTARPRLRRSLDWPSTPLLVPICTSSGSAPRSRSRRWSDSTAVMLCADGRSFPTSVSCIVARTPRYTASRFRAPRPSCSRPSNQPGSWPEQRRLPYRMTRTSGLLSDEAIGMPGSSPPSC